MMSDEDLDSRHHQGRLNKTRFRPKKFSTDSSSSPIHHHHPDISIYAYDGGNDSVTESLEKAVRKISRGSSPNMPPRVSPVLEFMNSLARGYEEYRASLKSILPPTEYGEASSDDLSSEWDTSDSESNNPFSPRPRLPTPQLLSPQVSHLRLPDPLPPLPAPREILKGEDSTTDEESSATPPSLKYRDRPSGWRKVRNVVQWTPFIQTYKNRKYQWVQLAGHSGNFKAGKSQGTVLKKLCVQESQCYEKFLHDSLRDFVPEFRGLLTLADDEKFIQLQDCLSSFKCPSIMDCKIGVRTYLEEELAKAKEKPKLRKDMYEKMIAVDTSAPTEEEHRLKGVTKPRYMVWRETISSTATLGFRIEGVKKADGTSKKDFKTTKNREQVSEAFRNFIASSASTAKLYLERLKKIRQALDKSEFFKSHELIGSSLLFVHDEEKASIWMIDFGKTVQIPESLSIDHKSPWEVGNHEDGYLIGMDNLIDIFESLATTPSGDLQSSSPLNASCSSSSPSTASPEDISKPFSEFSIHPPLPSSSSSSSHQDPSCPASS
eukprot:TRINITY_DN3035_c0_g1_i1.p1 TRINITY_DN3035_c0_g1~~TRINITY_DN3035_c0_g1_i1.p1  ORF type:complete len:548 (-),score=153.11 TRINITY_DN3035_c0_g1_i1:99-1742(-)